ncbi:hypothetical protein LPJ61_003368 [Coemansia biformis]|uniref:Essential protein Yae1 N-terminal domain-containing protein n=1 Tax=Coemansia biformis TaxID=1286918 RepID=A0A9W8CYP6_9FUNG|nr:hypothetical protein LPJ61_003368 [Coemansia biformis]
MDRIADVEREFESAGYAEGIAAGRAAGIAEGRELGCEHGFDIGKDLGFYRGWAQAWLRAAAAHPGLVPDRAQAKLRAIQDAVDAVPMTNDDGAHFAERIKAVQLKFKVAAAMLGASIATELPTETLSY